MGVRATLSGKICLLIVFAGFISSLAVAGKASASFISQVRSQPTMEDEATENQKCRLEKKLLSERLSDLDFEDNEINRIVEEVDCSELPALRENQFQVGAGTGLETWLTITIIVLILAVKLWAGLPG